MKNTGACSIGTLIVLMIWIQLNCFIILVGFELNAGIAVIRDRRRENLGPKMGEGRETQGEE